MGLFKKKPNGCIVFVGSVGRVINDIEVTELRDKHYQVIKEYVAGLYGDIPVSTFTACTRDYQDENIYVISTEAIRDIQKNGFCKSDRDDKKKLYDFTNFMLKTLYGQEATDVKCFIELEGIFKDMFFLLCPVFPD